MSIIWADNFDNYGTTESRLLDGLYADYDSISIETDPDPNETGRCIKVGDATQGFLRHVFSATGLTTAGMSMRVWLTEIPESESDLANIFQLRDSSNVVNVSIVVSPTGTFRAYRGSSDGTLLGESTAAMTAQAWHHVEVKVTVDSSAGAVEVRYNGVTVLSLTGQNTQAGAANLSQVYFASKTGGITGTFQTSFYMKDYIVWDTTGSQNNDFLGTCHVYTLRPDGDSSLNWDVSTGTTGYNLIDDTSPDDADYISADDTPPGASVFTLEDLPPDIVSVKALIPVTRMAKIDGGDGNVQMGLTSNGSTDLGADNPITTAFTYWWDVSELSPDTGVSWTPSEVDDALFQIDRTTP